MTEAIRFDHPSYGLVGFSRITTTPSIQLFQSSIPHQHYVRMEVHGAQLLRQHNRDVVFEKGLIVSVNMSSTQFAQAITSMNTKGSPCTIAVANGEKIDSTTHVNKRMQFDDEFAEYIANVASDNNRYIEDIKEILAKKHIGKKDRVEIEKHMNGIQMQLVSNLPFIKKQFSVQMDRTVLEAKNEIQGFVEDMVRNYGLEGLEKELLAFTLGKMPELGDDTKVEE